MIANIACCHHSVDDAYYAYMHAPTKQWSTMYTTSLMFLPIITPLNNIRGMVQVKSYGHSPMLHCILGYYDQCLPCQNCIKHVSWPNYAYHHSEKPQSLQNDIVLHAMPCFSTFYQQPSESGSHTTALVGSTCPGDGRHAQFSKILWFALHIDPGFAWYPPTYTTWPL